MNQRQFFGPYSSTVIKAEELPPASLVEQPPLQCDYAMYDEENHVWLVKPFADQSPMGAKVFEGIGDLYCRRHGRLRPGKDDRPRNSMDESNIRQFNEWIQNQALTDAVSRIIDLELKLARYEPG
jgi:hypothetical protein